MSSLSNEQKNERRSSVNQRNGFYSYFSTRDTEIKKSPTKSNPVLLTAERERARSCSPALLTPTPASWSSQCKTPLQWRNQISHQQQFLQPQQHPLQLKTPRRQRLQQKQHLRKVPSRPRPHRLEWIATSKLSASLARRVIRQATKQKLTASRRSTKNQADPVVTNLPYWQRLRKTNQRKSKSPSPLQSISGRKARVPWSTELRH